GGMVIEELDPASAPEWDEYVSGKEGANCYHLHAWRTAGERGYGLRAPYLVARSRARGELLGVLPLFFVRSAPWRGYATTGLFGSYGRLLADEAATAALLLREAGRRARDAGLASLRFTGLGPEPAAAEFIDIDRWVVATVPLWPDAQAAWGAIRGKERNLVRKARACGLEVRRGAEGIPAFYDVLADNMHHKGAPIYGRRFLEELVRAFGASAQVVTVHHGERCVAGAVTLTFKGVITIPFLSSRPDALALRPNVLLVWDIIERACEAGLKVLDFGTSLRGSSSLAFKLHWGARTVPRSILVRPLRGRPPALDVETRMIRAGVALWQRLPRTWADALGPGVCGRFLA
ncbi:MAG: GNAT family N-acetyltransferase, partial [Myxococcales bacterium]